MAAAAKVEPQMNTIGEVLPDLPKGGGERDSYESKNTDKNYECYEHKLPLKLGTHAGWLALLVLFGLKSRDSIPRDLDLQLFGNSQLDRVILEPGNRAVNPPVGDHLIA